MAKVGIALGSNLGDRLATLREAVKRLAALQSSTHFLASPIYETTPVDCPPGSGSFLNAVLEIETLLTPHALLAATQTIEQDLGRPSEHGYNTPRTVDLDILYYDDLVMQDDDLVLPHPRMGTRAFVLHPLSTIRPDLVTDVQLQEVGADGIQILESEGVA